jgi:hypothetical protein
VTGLIVGAASTDGLRSVLATVRKPRDEAQWTQLIASVCERDGAFAGRFVGALLECSPRTEAARQLGEPPDALRCRAEVSLDSSARSLGRVDLVFDDYEDDFVLLVELKLGSQYGDRQLERYAKALDGIRGRRKALLAITATTPLYGETTIGNDHRWLGSLRWSQLYDALHTLAHADPLVEAAWRSALELLREQGDFGPMDFDPTVMDAWARRDEAERLIRYLLEEVAKPVEQILQSRFGTTGGAVILGRGKTETSVVWPWRNRMHLKYAVPADVGEERLWVQFHAGGGAPFFSVEARYEHPREAIENEAIAAASRRLKARAFGVGNDGWGHYWARAVPALEVLEGPATIDRMLEIADQAALDLADSGLLAALAQLKPSGPPASPPDEAA